MIPIAQFPPPNKRIFLEANFSLMSDGTNRATFNGITYNYPKVPSALIQVQYANQTIPEVAYGYSAFILNHLEVVDIILKNSDSGSHPFHLHGHEFQIVNRASNYSSDDPILNPPLVEGQVNPIRRDTVTVLAGGSVILRFVADNPGSWIFHCHIEWHLSAGLHIVFMEATPLLAHANVPPMLKEQCLAQGLLAEGNAAGNLNPYNLSGLPFGPFPCEYGPNEIGKEGIKTIFKWLLAATLGMAVAAWYKFSKRRINETEGEKVIEEVDSEDEWAIKDLTAAPLLGVFKD